MIPEVLAKFWGLVGILARWMDKVDVVEMGQMKVFVQELGLKQGFLADTNMDYFTSEWPGTPNFKVDANFDVFPQKYG